MTKPPAPEQEDYETADTLPLLHVARVADTWPLFRASEPVPPKDEQH